jgi:hypothetical protein
MLKWAMRIVAVSGAMLAMAVGTAAWMHRTKGRDWEIATPSVWMGIMIDPKYVNLGGWLRRDWDPGVKLKVEGYAMLAFDWDNTDTNPAFRADINHAQIGGVWSGFGFVHGNNKRPPRPSYTEVLCPTWAAIAFLLTPMGRWAFLGWRQRRRVRAGHCANCGYDLRATPEKCPECGRAV